MTSRRLGPKVSIVLSCQGCAHLAHYTVCGCLVATCTHSSAPKDNRQQSLLTPEWCPFWTEAVERAYGIAIKPNMNKEVM